TFESFKRYSPRGRGSNAKKLSRLAISRQPRGRQGNVGAAAGCAFWRTATEGNDRRRDATACDFAILPMPRRGWPSGEACFTTAAIATSRAPNSRKTVAGTVSPMDAYAHHH